ncbi:unnamed protein product [Protopolystoma xenopodis]|uniref:Uncharacterized protein n=1 Tax=Protopolystoma xenopodis TaxID=117903 RepID=A0A448WKM9_9PLAT|nr:unnamed protein product [Protopolystoma xenopodis]
MSASLPVHIVEGMIQFNPHSEGHGSSVSGQMLTTGAQSVEAFAKAIHFEEGRRGFTQDRKGSLGVIVLLEMSWLANSKSLMDSWTFLGRSIGLFLKVLF